MAAHDRTGRSRGAESYVGIPRHVMSSPGFRATSPFARAVLLEVVRLYYGSNNGKLYLSVRQAGSSANCAKDTAWRALKDLEHFGLIEKAKEGLWKALSPAAAQWRLTWRTCDRTGKLPSKAFERLPETGANQKAKKTFSGHTRRTARSGSYDSGADFAARRSGQYDS